jgi:substrate import-associated zinc metallohydrolase lipoprotein
MRYLKYISSILVFGLLSVSCEDSYNDEVGLSDTDYLTNDPDYTPNELDHWLLNNFTYPFNIEVKYRWDASEGDIYRTLVPPKVSQVQPVMEVVKSVWIDTYGEVAGGDFIRQYCPKQFLLIGSARYNLDGTFTLGTAEAGRKVVLYVVNEFEATDRSAIKDMMHVVHHEFGHILNQKVVYPSAFREITSGLYSSDWRFTSVAEARAKGFITNYAMSSPDEDFVEMISTMLIEGREGYEAILECGTTPASLKILREKEKLVVQYYKEAFNIDFYSLQEKVQEAIDELAPPGEDPQQLPALFDEWGFDKANKTVRFDLSLMNEPAEFTMRYNQDNTILHNTGFALDYNFKMSFSSADVLELRLYYYELADENKVYQQANFYYSVQGKSDGTVELIMVGGDANAQYLFNDLHAQALALFFAGREFTIDWLQSCSGDVYAAFYPTDSPENYCFGILEN